MSQKPEKAPLLSPSSNNTTANNSNTPALFPAIVVGSNNVSSKSYYNPSYQPGSSYYGVIEITPSGSAIQLETRERKLRQPGGIISSPIVAIIAITVGLVLILTFASTTNFNVIESEGKLEKGQGNNLKAAAPATETYSRPQPRSRTNHKQVLTQSAPSESHIDIEIPQGRLRGYKKLSRDGREYNAFYKVPYAAPPLGNLRFKDPQPPSPWQGLRDNPVVAPQCIQKEKYGATPNSVAGEEDCLYANIYTPRLPQSNDNGAIDNRGLLPTMVYVHKKPIIRMVQQ